MSDLQDKVKRSLKVLRMYRGDDPIEVSYSGGKDSDVILALTAHNLFFDDYGSFQAANNSMFGKEDWKQRLEDYLKLNNYGNTKD